MNCLIHQDTIAVAQCADCGVGICSSCVNQSEYRIDNRPICRDCNHKLIKEMIVKNKSRKNKTVIILIINAFFLFWGIMVFPHSFLGGILLFAIGGIPMAWKLLSPNATERVFNKVDDRIANHEFVGGGLINSFLRLAIRIFLSIVIGVVAAPILLIINIVKFFKCKNVLKKNKVLLTNFVR